jgi:hypothetical protein
MPDLATMNIYTGSADKTPGSAPKGKASNECTISTVMRLRMRAER